MGRDKRTKKSNLTLEEYFALIEELLRLTGRQIKRRELINPDGFKL